MIHNSSRLESGAARGGNEIGCFVLSETVTGTFEHFLLGLGAAVCLLTLLLSIREKKPERCIAL